MYKILQVIGKMDRGGAETFIINVLRNIDKEKYHFDFLLNVPGGDYEQELLSYGCKIYYVASRNAGFLSYLKNLNYFFKTHKYDAIHQHVSSLTAIEPLYFARKYKIPKRIIHSHSTKAEGWIHKIIHYLNKTFLKNLCTDYLACSALAGDWLFSHTGIKNTKVIVLNNGIDCKKYLFSDDVRKEYRSLFGYKYDTVVLAHIGRFDENKNQRFVVDVFAEYKKINSNSKLIFLGRGETEGAVKEYVKECLLDADVSFAGVRSDVCDCVKAFDYLIFPSHFEGLPVTLIEAQASGLFVFASDKVSSEAKISDCLKFIPLENSAEYWAHEICNSSYPDRYSQNSLVIEHGYDITQTTSILENAIYI